MNAIIMRKANFDDIVVVGVGARPAIEQKVNQLISKGYVAAGEPEKSKNGFHIIKETQRFFVVY